MNGWGTDALAIACIVGGAAVGGGATWAFLDGSPHVDSCVAYAVTAPNVIVRGRGSWRVITAAPSARVRGDRLCVASHMGGERVRIRVRRLQASAETVRVRAEVARARAEEARARMEVDAARARVEAIRKQMDELQTGSAKLPADVEKVGGQAASSRAPGGQPPSGS